MSLFLDKQYYEDIKNLHNPITREEAFQLFLKGYSFVPITTMLDTDFYISVYIPWEQDYFYVIPNNFYERENGCQRILSKRKTSRTSFKAATLGNVNQKIPSKGKEIPQPICYMAATGYLSKPLFYLIPANQI